MKTKTKITITLCGVVLVAIAIGLICVWRYVSAPFEGAESVRVNIPATTDATTVRGILTEALGDSYGSKVATIWNKRRTDGAALHGSFVVEPGTPAYRFAQALVRGHQTPVRLTFNNLRTIGQLAARVGNVLEADSAAFMQACDSILPAAGFSKPTYAAAFLPDSYEFYWTADPATVVEKLNGYTRRFWNDERTAKAAALGLNPAQVATIASIVEEETNKADERPTVARLYMNRLAKNMPLQADPTVKFAIGDFSLRRITGKHLTVDSPYNTYRNTGLPPGPIRIAEGATLDAVLNAPENNYLYMCAKSNFSGYHDFTDSYDRHRINAARYHRALTNRGIK